MASREKPNRTIENGGNEAVRPGGIIHTYQRYDPVRLPGPSQPPVDLASRAAEHMLRHGSLRELTEEELARAVRLDPSQIGGLGPNLEALIELLEERLQNGLADSKPRELLIGVDLIERQSVAPQAVPADPVP